MARRLLFVLVALASCSAGPEADLPSISEARSLAAEWALVNQQAAEGHLTPAYVKTMRQAVHEQLKTAANALTEPQSPYGREIAVLLQEPPDAEPAVLSTHAEKLKRIEDQLESA